MKPLTLALVIACVWLASVAVDAQKRRKKCDVGVCTPADRCEKQGERCAQGGVCCLDHIKRLQVQSRRGPRTEKTQRKGKDRPQVQRRGRSRTGLVQRKERNEEPIQRKSSKNEKKPKKRTTKKICRKMARNCTADATECDQGSQVPNGCKDSSQQCCHLKTGPCYEETNSECKSSYGFCQSSPCFEKRQVKIEAQCTNGDCVCCGCKPKKKCTKKGKKCVYDQNLCIPDTEETNGCADKNCVCCSPVGSTSPTGPTDPTDLTDQTDLREPTDQTDPTGPTDPTGSSDPSKLTILHINDAHSRFDQVSAFAGDCSEEDAEDGKCFGGFSRLLTAVKQLRQTDPNVVFMAAGDFYTGTVWFTVHKGKIFADLLPKLGLDVMSFGNHEFDDGIEGIVPFLEEMQGKLPVVTANIDTSGEPNITDLFTASTIITRGDRRVGVVGFVTPVTKIISKPGNLVFTDEVEAVRREAQILRSQGVNTIVALGHSGFPTERKIAREVEEVDIVVGGHSNTFLYNGDDPSIEESVDSYPVVEEQASGKKVPVVQAFAYTKYLGRIQLTLDDEGRVTAWEGNSILLNSSYDQDPEMEQLLKPYRDQVQTAIQQKVGETLVFLNAQRPECRLVECNLGNLVADSFVHRYAVKSEDGWGQTALAVVNSGGVRFSVDESADNGEITMGDILQILPFGGTVDLVDLRGDDVRRMFERSVRDYFPNDEDPGGHFLQVSGFEVVYDYSQPPGSRVVQLRARCLKCRVPEMEDVVDNETYTVAMGNFLVNGGDDYDVIDLNKTRHVNTGYLDADVFSEFVQAMSPVYPGKENRISFVNSENSETRSVDEEKYYSRKHRRYISLQDLYKMNNQQLRKRNKKKQ